MQKGCTPNTHVSAKSKQQQHTKYYMLTAAFQSVI